MEDIGQSAELQPLHQQLTEKYTILFKPELSSLNQHDEFFSHCRHKLAKLLDKT